MLSLTRRSVFELSPHLEVAIEEDHAIAGGARNSLDDKLLLGVQPCLPRVDAASLQKSTPRL